MFIIYIPQKGDSVVTFPVGELCVRSLLDPTLEFKGLQVHQTSRGARAAVRSALRAGEITDTSRTRYKMFDSLDAITRWIQDQALQIDLLELVDDSGTRVRIIASPDTLDQLCAPTAAFSGHTASA